MTSKWSPIISLAIFLAIAAAPAVAWADANHAHGDDGRSMMKQMREMHRTHEHGHDFSAMEEMGPERMQQMLGFMRDVGLAFPPMEAHRGRTVFVKKGCVVCHAVNKVGGDIGPSLDAANMPKPMNAFEFAARMWRGAEAMAAMQQEEFGEVISLDGQELADLIAFAHDAEEQKKLSVSEIPANYLKKIQE